MSDWIGSFSAGDVRLPATFHGTARLLDGSETPTPPRPARHDDLPGRFEAELDISFALLTELGYQPVDPSHPAWPLYLAASAAHAQAPPATPASAIDRHAPDAVVVPFETTVIVTEERALRHGLVAPGRAGPSGAVAGQGVPVRRKPAPPPWQGAASSTAGRSPAPSSQPGDGGAFLPAMAEPEQHPEQATLPRGTGRRVLDLVMGADAPLPPAIRAIIAAAGNRTGRDFAVSARSSDAVASGVTLGPDPGLRDDSLNDPAQS